MFALSVLLVVLQEKIVENYKNIQTEKPMLLPRLGLRDIPRVKLYFARESETCLLPVCLVNNISWRVAHFHSV